MIRWLQRWWWSRQRAIDMQVLWPACVQQSGGDLDMAKAAFALHAFNDAAWVREYEDRLFSVIDRLEPPHA